jgi:hypothetical protein
MSKTYKSLLLSMLFFVFIGAHGQQVQPAAPAAPIPPQILNGKKAFISNAGIDSYLFARYIADHSGSPDGLYDQFYASMKTWGKYDLVATPAESDLVFEISLNRQFGQDDPQFSLRILDTQTRIVLWTFVQQVGAGSGRAEARRKAWNSALDDLLNSVKALAAQSGATTPSKP